MIRKSLFAPAIVLATLVAVAGCSRDAQPAPEPAPAADATMAVTADVVPAAAPAPADAAPAIAADGLDTGLDAKAFAGTFSGTLPCADCPGIDSQLQLSADGNFVLTETYQERKAAPLKLEGTWTAEAGGSRIRLDPNSKRADDRLYSVDSHDQLSQLDGDGMPVASGLDYRLKRASTAP